MEQDYLNRLVNKIDFSSLIPPEQMAWLCKRMHRVKLKKDDYFLQAGEVPEYIGMNRKGLLRLFYIDREGNDVTKHFCIENTLAISYTSFVSRNESEIFIQAVEDTDLSVLDYGIYSELMERHACWQTVSGRITEMLFALKEKREAELLLMNAEQRYLQFLKDYPDLEERLTGYHIASYIGIKPESLSRIRAKFR